MLSLFAVTHAITEGKITKCLVNAANFNAKSMLSTRVIGGTFTNNENIHHTISLYIQLSGLFKVHTSFSLQCKHVSTNGMLCALCQSRHMLPASNL